MRPPPSDAALERRETQAIYIAARVLDMPPDHLIAASRRAASGTIGNATRDVLRWTYVDHAAMDGHFAAGRIAPLPTNTLIFVQHARVHGVDKRTRQLPAIDRQLTLLDHALPGHVIVSPISIVAQDRFHAIVQLLAPHIEPVQRN